MHRVTPARRGCRAPASARTFSFGFSCATRRYTQNKNAHHGKPRYTSAAGQRFNAPLTLAVSVDTPLSMLNEMRLLSLDEFDTVGAAPVASTNATPAPAAGVRSVMDPVG